MSTMICTVVCLKVGETISETKHLCVQFRISELQLFSYFINIFLSTVSFVQPTMHSG